MSRTTKFICSMALVLAAGAWSSVAQSQQFPSDRTNESLRSSGGYTTSGSTRRPLTRIQPMFSDTAAATRTTQRTMNAMVAVWRRFTGLT